MKRPAITAQMRLQVLRDHGAVVLCQVCMNTQRIADVAIDHTLALIDGGEHATANLRPVCGPCHAKKSAREHIGNAKAKRLAKAKEAHEAVLAKTQERKPGKIRSRGFQGHRKFNGELVKR